jgi:hypothetical protein
MVTKYLSEVVNASLQGKQQGDMGCGESGRFC